MPDNLFKCTVKLSEVQQNQLKTIMKIEGFTTYSEEFRSALRHYFEEHTSKKINKPLDNGDNNEDPLGKRDK